MVECIFGGTGSYRLAFVLSAMMVLVAVVGGILIVKENPGQREVGDFEPLSLERTINIFFFSRRFLASRMT
jgi:hypothetical protein